MRTDPPSCRNCLYSKPTGHYAARCYRPETHEMCVDLDDHCERYEAKLIVVRRWQEPAIARLV